MPSAQIPIVGRDTELEAVRGFVESDAAPRALVLAGGPGIGKTTLWEAGVELARERGLRVLDGAAERRRGMAHVRRARATCAATSTIETLAALPAPQRAALRDRAAARRACGRAAGAARDRARRC